MLFARLGWVGWLVLSVSISGAGQLDVSPSLTSCLNSFSFFSSLVNLPCPSLSS